MTAPKFIFGMLLVMMTVGIWSYMDGVSAGVIALRIFIAAVLLQVGYFVFIVAAAWKEARIAQNAATRKPADTRHSDSGELIDEASRSAKSFPHGTGSLKG